MFDINRVRKDFPILSRTVNGKPLVYLDNAATSQKPQVVIDALVEYYSMHNANVHRGIHMLGDESTTLFHQARADVSKFFGAQENELVWVRNTTEAINLAAYSWGRSHLASGDVIVTSQLEHHSDLVTWQELAKSTQSSLEFVNVTDEGEVDMAHFESLLKKLGKKIKLVALAHVSNATGAVLPINQMVKLVREHTQAKILIDGAQSAPHLAINFKDLDIDFMAFSGHKMYGPMGIGGLLVKHAILKEMQPMLFGGGMISEVHLEETSFADLPDRFDAGTPNVADAVGLAAAVKYLESLGMDNVQAHSRELTEYALHKLSLVDGAEVVGPKLESRRLGSVAFRFNTIHAHDVAQILNSEGIAVRSGHHCTMPLHEKFGWVATTRASFGIYNTKSEIDLLVVALEKVKQIFKG